MFKRNLELWIPLIAIFIFGLANEFWLQKVSWPPIRILIALVLGVCFAVIGKWCFFKKPWFLLKVLGCFLMFAGALMLYFYIVVILGRAPTGAA